MMNFTIAIPTYNGAKRLPNVFNALQHQRVVPGLVWEVLVVDNNSLDHTTIGTLDAPLKVGIAMVKSIIS